jgi:hypothetical protein
MMATAEYYCPFIGQEGNRRRLQGDLKDSAYESMLREFNDRVALLTAGVAE